MSEMARTDGPSAAESKLGVLRIALKGLKYYSAMLWPVALGVAAATAVIVGALLVGDSVRGSLRYLALDRLGKIDHLLIAPRFFSQSTVGKWLNASGYPIAEIGAPLPAIVFPQSSIERARSVSNPAFMEARSGNALVMGVTQEFWLLGDSMPSIEIGVNEIVLNEALAGELRVSIGDKVTLRLPAQSAVPADSPLGRRDGETVNLPGLTIVQIIENRSLGRFDIRSNQRPSKNAYVAMETIQEALGREGQVNAAILPQTSHVLLPSNSNSRNNPVSVARNSDLINSLPLTLSDMGYKVTHVKREFPDVNLGETSRDPSEAIATIFDYFQITSDQMLIPDKVVDRVRELWPESASSPVLTYLANGIRKGTESLDQLTIPYSTVTAIEPSHLKLKSVGFPDNSLNGLESWKEDEVLVNTWLADQLNLSVGDSLSIDYYLPETIDGREVEQTFTAKIAAIVPLSEPDTGYRRKRAAKFKEKPTVFNDPSLTPEVPGITDQDSMSDWDLPFPLTRKIRREDDDYWTNHRLTPKLFLPKARGQSLFGSRFGATSSIRLSSEEAVSIEEIDAKLVDALRPIATDLGWQIIPLREQQLAASRGTTPFDVLFLALSFFVILAALILVSLLFRLGIERRASHWGLMLSLGWPLHRVRHLLFIEGLCLASVGGLLGVGLGILYASGVLALLHSWWVGAVGAPFLTFFMTRQSLFVGLLAGVLMASLTIWYATRFLAHQPMVRLLRGRVESPIVRHKSSRSIWSRLAIAGIFLMTIIITVAGLFLSGQAAGGAFVGAGMLALVGMLTEISNRLRSSSRESSGLTLMTLAASSIRRNPLRSVLAIGLVSVATLLILSMSLFEAVPDAQGTGGFQLMADSSVSIGKSLSDDAYLKETLGKDAAIIGQTVIIPLRVRDGDDAGCNNLYQATQPRVIGMSTRIVDFDQNRKPGETFAWAGAAAATSVSEKESHWRLLEREADGTQENPFPVIIDQNTALWALHLTGGIGQRFSYQFGLTELHFETVALLQNTILQGSLILGETNFTRAFPDVNGYRSWLVHLPASVSSVEATSLLESGWADEGMDAIESDSVLRNLLAVQNTYLKAFQSLGALGLLLGTFGLAVVQLRSVMERQSEFGLLRAVGFSRARIGRLILLESLVLLVAGLGVGCIAAAIALVPTIFHGTIRPSFLSPAAMLGIVAICGILASLIAVRRAMQLKPLEALRGN